MLCSALRLRMREASLCLRNSSSYYLYQNLIASSDIMQLHMPASEYWCCIQVKTLWQYYDD